ncbi:hypothetical protein [Spirosoma spitsbergense]|jgi:hypothetical protein|uniref:hypothetical protein n=1 Tax=Spirosoma spitsbergense TaxID=431554 RepID=UPI000365DF29|nr:hypothetical protein [Spirosoma spitsbergense]
MTLTPDQLTAIDNHLRQENRLTNEALLQELTDHYTTALSERVAQGMPFESALSDVQQAFGGHKGLQKMERGYNRITFQQYDSLWMKYIRKQGRWPHCLMPLFVFGVVYWTTTDMSRPTSFSVGTLVYTPWFGFILGSIAGLLIKFIQLVVQGGIRGKNFPYKARYLVTRVIPVALLLYGISVGLTYLNAYLPPFVYETTLSACAALIIMYTISYSQFYQAVSKGSRKASW